jgi:acetyl-CoA acetyltransferase
MGEEGGGGNRDMSWVRNRRGLGTYQHRGKVAIVGWGQSYIDRRWDGQDMTKTSGAKSMEAIAMAIEDAGITMDDVDGLITAEPAATRAEQTWAPRPYFQPPYDGEDGIIGASGEWIQKQMGFKNIKYIDSNAGDIWGITPRAAVAVGEGRCDVAVAYYPMCNLEGRYGQNNPANFAETARGGAQFNLPWGYQSGAMFNNAVAFLEYCQKYNSSHDALAPFALNNRRNGLMVPWGFYPLHEPYQLTREDYLNGRLVEEPLVVYDCDRPIHTCHAYIFMNSEKAKAMSLRHPPVYILSHASTPSLRRSTMFTLEEMQEECAIQADVQYEGSGLSASEIDIFNPYDGYLTFTQQFLEGHKWHGVGLGEAHAFYAGDIRVEGPHPFMSSGGNNGVGRQRACHYTDVVEQLRTYAGDVDCGPFGPLGTRRVTVKAETGIAGYGNMLCMAISAD